ncbi:DUF2267 domain-containing protein [Shinella sp. NM-101]|uniref:DUF2267 domain-containing protein n=1 Tax=Shinella sp. NM-101 TaxID=2744455 RepID=UPI001F42A859|nr:DUF2267 domain-containing protein [Shinella sp. NM-101]
MPIPMEYRLAAKEFDNFLADVAMKTNLGSRHQAYTTTQGVFFCFRRRLSIHDAISFVQVLPAMLRALFVSDWNTNELQEKSWDRDLMADEVKQLRKNHNFSPDTAINDVACVLRKYVDEVAFERCLKKLPPHARAFWL